MKIRYVVFNAYAFGGTTRTVISQANALCERHEVEIASVYRAGKNTMFPLDKRVKLVSLSNRRSDGTSYDGRKPVGERRAWFRTHRTPLAHGKDFRFADWDPQVELRIIRYLRRQRGGVLITTRPGLHLLAARFAPRHRLAMIAQEHLNVIRHKPKVLRPLIRGFAAFDALVLLTQRDADAAAQLLGDRPDRILAIENGLAMPDELAEPASSKQLLAAGRLCAQKGFDMLLDAYAEVGPDRPDWRLLIHGNGEWQAKLVDKIAALDLRGVQLKGSTDRLPEKMTASAAYVLSSRREGLPMVVLEAMSHGLPIVSFDCPTGPRELVEHERNGLLVPEKDVRALAKAMAEVMDAPERRTDMGAASRELVQRFSITEVAKRWEALFDELVDETGRRRRRPSWRGLPDPRHAWRTLALQQRMMADELARERAEEAG